MTHTSTLLLTLATVLQHLNAIPTQKLNGRESIVVDRKPSTGCDGPPWVGYSVNIIHQPNNPRSVQTKTWLITKFCEAFFPPESPCIASSASLSQNTTNSLHFTSDTSIFIPPSHLHTALPWLAQQANAHVGGHNLDLSIHAIDSRCGETAKFEMFVGAKHNFNAAALYRSTTRRGSAPTHPPTKAVKITKSTPTDDWIFNCAQSDCPLPYANETKCTDAIHANAFHVHFHFARNDVTAVTASEKVHLLLTEVFRMTKCDALPVLGSPEPCWLPEPEYPQKIKESPFVTGTITAFVPNAIWTEFIGWVLMYRQQEYIGDEIDVMTHPITGCDYADHVSWAIHIGNIWPSNNFGLSLTSHNPNPSAPPPSDPKSPSYPYPTESCESSFDEYVLHILFDPSNKTSVDAKTSMLQTLGRMFPDIVKNGELFAIEDDPYAYMKGTSPFVTGQVQIRVSSTAVERVLPWVMENRPIEVDLLFAPDGSCMFRDYFVRSMYFGNSIPFNEFGLSNDNLNSILEFDAGALTSDNAEEELEGETPIVKFDEASEDSACTKSPWSGYLLYVLYPPNNAWASAAVENFLQKFADFFELDRKECAIDYPVPKQSPQRLCMMNEVLEPFLNPADPMVTSYANVFLPASNLTEVLAWTLDNKTPTAVGYGLDVWLVPLCNCIEGFTQFAVKSGADWPLNKFALQNLFVGRQSDS